MKTHTKLVSSLAAVAGLSSGVVAAWSNLGVLESARSRDSSLPAGVPGTRINLIGNATEALTQTIGAAMPKVAAVASPTTTTTTATPAPSEVLLAPTAEVLGLQFGKSAGGVVTQNALTPAVAPQPQAPTVVAASVEEPPLTTTTTTAVPTTAVPPTTTVPPTDVPPAPPTVVPVPPAPVDGDDAAHGTEGHHGDHGEKHHGEKKSSDHEHAHGDDEEKLDN